MKKHITIALIILVIYSTIRVDYLPKFPQNKTISLLKNKDTVTKISLVFNKYSINIINENNLWLISDEGKKMALEVESNKIEQFLSLAQKPITLRLIDDSKDSKSTKINFSLYGLDDNQAQHLIFYKQGGGESRLTFGHYSPLKDGIFIKYNNNVYIATINKLEQSLRKLI